MQSNTPMTLKDRIATLQSAVVIIATVVGATWTYTLFVKERKNFPSASIQQTISHVELPGEKHLVRVGVEVKNVGSRRLVIDRALTRVQRIMPVKECGQTVPCAKAQLEAAAANYVRDSDRFSWPLLAERSVDERGLMDLEPAESHFHEMEFVVPAEVKVVRVYSYFQNEKRSAREGAIGWSDADYYSIVVPQEVKK